jgi:hypothetical protein
MCVTVTVSGDGPLWEVWKVRDDGFYAMIAVADAAAALERKGSPKIHAIDFRRNYYAPGDHARIYALQEYPFAYNRDVANFGSMREVYAIAEGSTDIVRYGGNADVLTTAVYRHPEYREAIRGFDPRSVFDDAATCVYCGREIRHVGGLWIDPEATGDDSVWRETCDAHDTFVAEHSPTVDPREEHLARTDCRCGRTDAEHDRAEGINR